MTADSQVFRVQLKHPLNIMQQQQFLRRVYNVLSKVDSGWNFNKQLFWVDFVYRRGQDAAVYITIPQAYVNKWIKQIQPRGRRRRTGGISFLPEVQGALHIQKQTPVCELKLKYENIFALASNESVCLPIQLPLAGEEVARISFCLVPSYLGWSPYVNSQLRHKTDKGQMGVRGNVSISSFFFFLLYLFDRFIHLAWLREKKAVEDVKWLTRETLKKMNDCHYKVYIRIAGPQRLLPKLAKPFTSIQGENKFLIHFFSQREQKALCNELNKQSLGLFSLSDLNPNILACGELGAVMPLFSATSPVQHDATVRPNFM